MSEPPRPDPDGVQWLGLPPVSDDPLGAAGSAPGPKYRARWITAGAAVVLIVAGALAYRGVSRPAGYRGAASPRQAVRTMVADLDKSDLLAVLEHAPPGERTALSAPLDAQLVQAKRLHVITPGADVSQVSGLGVSLSALVFDRADEQVNGHVAITKIVGGSITYDADLLKLPVTAQYLKAVLPAGLPDPQATTSTVDIGDQVRRTGRPIRIAAQKVAGRWYASLFYTIADAEVHDRIGRSPTAADYIAANGATTPEAAVRRFIGDVGDGDTSDLISLLPPDEMAVLHDYGALIVAASRPAARPAFTVEHVQLGSAQLGDVVRVMLQSMSLTERGVTFQVSVVGDCLDIEMAGIGRVLCPNDAIDAVNAGRATPLTPQQSDALLRLIAGVANVGVDTVQSGGRWYLDPVQSVFDISSTLLTGLQDNDLLVLIQLAAKGS